MKLRVDSPKYGERIVGAALRGRPLPDIQLSEAVVCRARGGDSFDG